MICHNITELNDKSDEELMILISGNTDSYHCAFDIIVTRHHKYLYHRCLHKLGQKSDVQDVLQETFFNVFRFASQFRNTSSFKTWLTTIADNQCYSLLRKNKRYVFTDDIVNYNETPEVNDFKDTNQLGDYDSKRTIDLILQEISLSAKEILGLRYWHELSLLETSSILGIGHSAAKMRLQRALIHCSDVYYERFNTTA